MTLLPEPPWIPAQTLISLTVTARLAALREARDICETIAKQHEADPKRCDCAACCSLHIQALIDAEEAP